MLKPQSGKTVRLSREQLTQRVRACERAKVTQGGLGFVMGTLSQDKLNGAIETPLFGVSPLDQEER